MEREQRIVTVPNVISVLRLLCVPLFVWLLVDDQGVAAALLLGVLGATDWVDGWIARHFDQGSNLGKVLDPLADRVLLIVAAVALLVDGSVPIVVGVLVLAPGADRRASPCSLLAMAGARRIDVQWAGKAGTLALMFAFPLFLLADTHRRPGTTWSSSAAGSSPSAASSSATTPRSPTSRWRGAALQRGPGRPATTKRGREGRHPGRR